MYIHIYMYMYIYTCIVHLIFRTQYCVLPFDEFKLILHQPEDPTGHS